MSSTITAWAMRIHESTFVIFGSEFDDGLGSKQCSGSGSGVVALATLASLASTATINTSSRRYVLSLRGDPVPRGSFHLFYQELACAAIHIATIPE
jgi:hypothetical protein